MLSGSVLTNLIINFNYIYRRVLISLKLTKQIYLKPDFNDVTNKMFELINRSTNKMNQ